MAKDLAEFLKCYPDVEFIHYHFVTLSGTLATRCLTKSRCKQLASKRSPLKVSLFNLNGLCPWHSLSQRKITGSDTLYPCWGSLRYLGPQEASVLCDVFEEIPRHLGIDSAKPFLTCPRFTLHKVLESAQEQDKLELLAGFEIEFYLVTPEDAANPSAFEPPTPFRSTSMAAASFRGKRASCIQACVRALEKAGIVVEQFHACGGPYQYEISTEPLWPLMAVDSLVQSLEIIRRIAIAHDYRALFVPEAFKGYETCGLHMHLSMAVKSGGQMEPPGSSDSNSFLAGILRRLPLLVPVGMPLDISYSRLGEVAAGVWVSWGHENRDVPIRQIADNHWEFRAIDATANMYLVTAAYIASGLLGLRNKQPLRIAPLTQSLRQLDDAALERHNVTTRMPTCLEDAIVSLSDPRYREGLDGIMGPRILDFYEETKRGEMEFFSAMGAEDRLNMYAAIY